MQGTTERDPIELELAQSLTAAIAAGRFELANRIMAELERRSQERPAAAVVDLAEERAKRNGGAP